MEGRSNQRYVNSMFDFIDAMKYIESSIDISAKLEQAIAEYGLTSFAISGIPLPTEDIAPYVLLNGWPADWFERYVSQNYVQVDPVIRHARVTDDVFIWSELLRANPPLHQARKLMQEASDFGMRDGLSVPLHLTGGLQAIVTFGGENIDIPPELRGILQLIAIYAHNRLRTLLANSKPLGPRAIPDVTPHERDVIFWCAEGKTNWEIAQILGRSENTVKHQLHNAQRKYNCCTRSQLIAESIRSGLIR